RTMRQMHQPLLVPHLLQALRSALTHRGRKVGTAEGAETVLFGRRNVGIARVDRRFQGAENQHGDEVSLVEDVIVGPCTQSAPIVQVPPCSVLRQAQSGADAILYLKEGCLVSHVVNTRGVGSHQLTDWLLTKGGGSNHELRDVRPDLLTREDTAEKVFRGDMTTAVARTPISGQLVEFCRSGLRDGV